MKDLKQDLYWNECLERYPWMQKQGHIFRVMLREKVTTRDEFEVYCQQFEGIVPYWMVMQEIVYGARNHEAKKMIGEVKRRYPGVLIDLTMGAHKIYNPVYGLKKESVAKVQGILRKFVKEKNIISLESIVEKKDARLQLLHAAGKVKSR